MTLGFDGAGDRDTGGNPDFIDYVEGDLGGKVVNGGFLLDNRSVAEDYLKQAQDFMAANPDGEIFVLGYSRGGNTAVEYANLLGENGIKVTGLVTFDPHAMVSDLELKHGNVERAINFYQKNPTDRVLGIFPTGQNPYVGSTIKGAQNVNLTGNSRFKHLNIMRQVLNDRENQGIYTESINNVLR